jgi:hypothetical protein
VSIRQAFNLLLSIMMISFAAPPPASSRTWNPTPEALARDYAVITDNRASGELIMLMWLATPMAAAGANVAAVNTMLDQYVVMTVVHACFNRTNGSVSFDEINTLEARDISDHPLVTVESIFRQSLGAMGNGMRTFLFEAGSVRSCEQGALRVPFAGDSRLYFKVTARQPV